jgi:tetratricopeptide (TPR) repeat protein
MKELKLRSSGKSVAKKFFFTFLFSLFSFLFSFSSCSSAPRQSGENFHDRNAALNQLNLANQAANRGRYEEALFILEEARRLAVSTDNPSLRIRTATSRGNFLFYLGRHADAFLEWENASLEGDASAEPVLAALARIYAIRARIILLANEPEERDAAGARTNSDIEELTAQLSREMSIVRADAVSTAAWHVTMGLAERQLGRWAEAEREVRRALEFHERNNNLEDAAYCWFLIASIRSFAGNHNASLEALRTAIRLDRQAENGFGLASSWQAMGDVYQRAGRLEEASSARQRAAEIYRAIGLHNRAENIEREL